MGDDLDHYASRVMARGREMLAGINVILMKLAPEPEFGLVLNAAIPPWVVTIGANVTENIKIDNFDGVTLLLAYLSAHFDNENGKLGLFAAKEKKTIKKLYGRLDTFWVGAVKKQDPKVKTNFSNP